MTSISQALNRPLTGYTLDLRPGLTHSRLAGCGALQDWTGLRCQRERACALAFDGKKPPPKPASLWLLLRHLQPLAAPDALNPVLANLNAACVQQGRHPAIAVSVTKPKSIAPTINAAHSAMALAFRQAVTLVNAAVTTSTRSTMSSGTATADTAKTVVANAIPTPVPTIKRPNPRCTSGNIEAARFNVRFVLQASSPQKQ